jgi:hypothetical protein
VILPRDTLIDITGLKRRSAVRRWLDRQGIPYLVGADGWPRVLQAVMMERLGAQAPQIPEPKLRLRHA